MSMPFTRRQKKKRFEICDVLHDQLFFMSMQLGNKYCHLAYVILPPLHNFYLLSYNFLTFPICRKNVVSLSNGISANVIFVWQEVCWTYHSHN